MVINEICFLFIYCEFTYMVKLFSLKTLIEYSECICDFVLVSHLVVCAGNVLAK